MSAFDVLNKLGNLLPPIEYRRHELTPDVLYILAWDDRSENMVCWLILNNANEHYGQLWTLMEYMFDNILPDLTYRTGIAFTGSNRPLHQWDQFDLDPLRITPDEYAAVVAEAEAQS